MIISTFLQISFKEVTKSVYSELYDLNIIPKPEVFTELYFENHENLPFEVLPQHQYSFTFAIHNKEYKNMNYPYFVYILTNNKKLSLQKGNVFLHQDQKQTASVHFSTSSALPKSEIVVTLPGKNQNIDFWINE